MMEASENELSVAGEYRQSGRKVEMRADAAAALHSLMTEARLAGAAIIPISGFRAVAFPRNNSRGVNYEPWHWRFVGSPDAMRAFEK